MKDEKINRFVKYLPVIRKVAGLSQEDVANEIGTSVTMIGKLENRQSEFTKVYYLAFRKVLDDRIVYTNNDSLDYVLDILIDDDDCPNELKDELADIITKCTRAVPYRYGFSKIREAADRAVNMFIEAHLMA